MPLYDYKCEEHGVFDAIAPLCGLEGRYACPTCGKPSKRLMCLSTPVGTMKSEKCFKNLRVPLGRTFTSSKEVDAFLKAKGLEHAGNYKPRGK